MTKMIMLRNPNNDMQDNRYSRLNERGKNRSLRKF